MTTGYFSGHRHEQGMVLLELIIALTIFALVSLGLVTALDRAYEVAGDRTEAVAVTRGLQNNLALLRGARIEPGERDLPDEHDGIAYHLAVKAEPLSDQKKQPVPGVYRATLTATWRDNDTIESQSVESLFYQP